MKSNRKKAWMGGWALLLVGLLFAAGLLSGCGVNMFALASPESTPVVPTVTPASGVAAEGHLVPRDSAWLNFEQAGKVAEVLVEEGQQVKQGDVLARLSNREQMDAALKAAELEQLNAQQALDELKKKAGLAGGQARQALAEAQKAAIDAHQKLDDLDTDDTQQKIDDAWVDVQAAKDKLTDAQDEFDKYKDLDLDNTNRKNAESDLKDAQKEYDDKLRAHDLLKNDLEQARAQAEEADAALADAQREYDARQNGPDPDELALAQSRLENAKAQVTAAQASLDNLELTAPFDGTIVHLDISSGEQVTPAQPIMQLADFSEWYVETSDLTEMEVVKVDTERPVQIVPDALPDLTLKGHVDRVSQYYSEKGGDILYTVRVRLDQVDKSLRWGMTVNTQFEEK